MEVSGPSMPARTCICARPPTFSRMRYPSAARGVGQATRKRVTSIALVGGGSPAILATLGVCMGSAAVFSAIMAAATIISGENVGARL